MPIKNINLARRGNNLVLLREIVLKTGQVVRQAYTFSPETFSIRAGEYGLDPIDDADDVWDMLLYEMNMDDDEFSPLLTAATLEEAREIQITRIRAERDKLAARPHPVAWTKEEQKAHDDVIAAMREHCPADRQLALLMRERMKLLIRDERKRIAAEEADTATPIQKLKRNMIDEIRRREGV